MKTYFLDTSAFLKRYLRETGSSAVNTLFEEGCLRYISTLCLLECFSNVRRLHEVDGLVTGSQLQTLQAAISSDIECGNVTVVNPTPADIEAAVQILAKRHLTAIDALQIAMAKILAPGAVLVSADAKLNRAATEQGLNVLDPNAPPRSSQ